MHRKPPRFLELLHSQSQSGRHARRINRWPAFVIAVLILAGVTAALAPQTAGGLNPVDAALLVPAGASTTSQIPRTLSSSLINGPAGAQLAQIAQAAALRQDRHSRPGYAQHRLLAHDHVLLLAAQERQRDARAERAQDAAQAAAAAAAAQAAQQARQAASSTHSASQASTGQNPPQQNAPVQGSGNAAQSALGICIRNAEEGGSYAWGPGNGGGAYQFQLGTWETYGGAASMYGVAGPAYQDQIFNNAIAAGGASNWTPYDGC